MQYLYNDADLKRLRQKLRKSPVLPEIILWRELRNSKLGKKFRRQYGVGKFVLDFYCPEMRIGIELDGHTHDNPESHQNDKIRQKFIERQNIKMIRFQNQEVLNNLEGVVEEIKKFL